MPHATAGVRKELNRLDGNGLALTGTLVQYAAEARQAATIDFQPLPGYHRLGLMSVLKGFGLGFLSFFLFVSLLVFGVAFTADRVALNEHFVAAQVDRLDIGALAEEEFAPTTHGTFSPELAAAVATATGKLQPQLKAEFKAANSEVYDYLLGRTSSLDLPAVLKRTVFSPTFVSAVIGDPAITALVEQTIKDELTADVPPADRALITPYLERALPTLDPWIQQQLNATAGPVVDYLVGQTPGLNVVVQLNTMKQMLRTSLHDQFVASPPPQLAGAGASAIEAAFNGYWNTYSGAIPASVVIDSETLGLSPSTSIRQSLADTETGLAEARRYIGYFRIGYILLIVFLVLVTAGIIAIHRSVKGSALNLGIVFLASGALQYIGYAVGNHYARAGIDSASADLPGAVRSWLPGVQAAALRPVEVFGLVLAALGLVLIAVSILYRPRHPLP